jgi:hypothetical protein
VEILVINQYGQNELKTSDFLPRVGDRVDMFYNPLPTVTQVVCWPSERQMATLGVKVDAIITVS